jgi:transposase InsO family protein
MNERVKFIAEYLAKEETFAELCEGFGISRKTGYKWVGRYEAEGVRGLEEVSRAPLTHPHAVPPDIAAEFVVERRKHPRWGPRKLIVVLQRRRPDLQLPAASTVGDILRKNGLVGRRRRIRRSSPYPDRLGGYESPNAVWCADFKGHFAVGGRRCHPVTITDGFSRFLLRCKALHQPRYFPTRQVFESAFREYGLPEAIRTDNGAPFSTLAPAGLSRLAVWWIRLGIRPERIFPGRPDQNGRHERMHSTLKAEACRPPCSSFHAQQRAFDAFRSEYNQVRPHEALGQATPASNFQASPRPLPRKLPEPEYPSHHELCRAYSNGVISFRAIQWYVSGVLAGELLGLEQADNDCWRVFFGPVLLGVLDVRRASIRGYRQFAVLVPADGQLTEDRRRRRRGAAKVLPMSSV